MVAVDAGIAVVVAVVAVVEDKLSNSEVSAFVVPESPNDCAVCQTRPIVDFLMTNDRKNL